MLVVELGHAYSQSEIKKLKTREKADTEKINQILKPAHTHPDLYHKLLTLSKILPAKVAKLREPYRSDFGTRLNQALAELFETYFNIISQSQDQSQDQSQSQYLLQNLDKLTANLIILNENKLLDISTISRLGKLILELKETIKRAFK
ncbi:hypothetical protein IKF34_01645 [Candidatus Saccharibacteria bacterium]|nr:hypothetical protein [Candidatus Saccharibacteria bacterium]